MHRLFWILVFLLTSAVSGRPQEVENVQPAGTVHRSLGAIPRGVAREFKLSATEFVTFRDPRWSALTMAQIAAATADGVTSIDNLNHCSQCIETGPSRFFVGQHPDAHKYVIAGIIEASVEAVTAHYFLRHAPSRKWYWRALWTLPQSISLYAHARASDHNANLL